MRSSRLLWLCGAVRPGCISGTCFWNWVRVRTNPSGPWGQEAGATCRLSVHPWIPDRSARCWPPPVGGEWGGGGARFASILPAVAEGSGVWPAELRPPCAPHSGQGAGSRRRWPLNGWFCSCQGPHSGPALDLHPEASPLRECPAGGGCVLQGGKWPRPGGRHVTAVSRLAQRSGSGLQPFCRFAIWRPWGRAGQHVACLRGVDPAGVLSPFLRSSGAAVSPACWAGSGLLPGCPAMPG